MAGEEFKNETLKIKKAIAITVTLLFKWWS